MEISNKFSEPGDVSLVEQMTFGDAAALRRFYDRHSPVAYALCLRILNDAHEAEDVLIEVFHEFWQRAGKFDASRGTPLGMLVNLTRSRAIDRRRSLSKISSVSLQDHDGDSTANQSLLPDEKLDEQQQIQRMRSALAALEPQQREVIECAFYDGMSHSEIASTLNKPLGTVKTYIRKGLLRLRDVLSRKDLPITDDKTEATPRDYA